MKKIVIASIATLTLATASMANATSACIGCHGKDGSRNTLVKDAVPNTLSKADIITSLQGYKKGTLNKFGKGMIMKNFAKNLSDAQMKEVADSWGK